MHFSLRRGGKNVRGNVYYSSLGRVTDKNTKKKKTKTNTFAQTNYKEDSNAKYNKDNGNMDERQRRQQRQ